MSVGVLEGLTSAIGDELTELAGFRSTRLTATLAPEQPVRSGLLSASSVDGVTVTLPAGAVTVAVVAGLRFRVLSGTQTNQSDVIFSVGPGDQVVLNTGINLGIGFTSESWEIVQDADDEAFVETTFGWDTEGTIIVDGVRYTYNAITPTSFQGLQHIENVRAVGRIQTIAGDAGLEGQTVTLDDGQGTIRTYEFDSDSSVVGGNVPVPYTVASSANDLRDALAKAINAPDFHILADNSIDLLVGLENDTAGVQGDTPVTTTVALAGFEVLGFAGGAVAHSGVIQEHLPPAEVVDFTQDFSAIDAYFRGFTSDNATGDDLSILGKNIGVSRPPPLVDDGIYRTLIQSIAYCPRGSMYALELGLTSFFSTAWETFEDFTKRLSPTFSPLNNNDTVYIRRTDIPDTQSIGKAFLDGDEALPSADAQAITTSQIPIAVEGVRLADDPSSRTPVVLAAFTKDGGREFAGRLVDFGTDAESTDGGQTISGTFAGSFLVSRALPGDIFEILTGLHAGARGVIASGTDALLTMVTNTPLEGVPALQLGTSFTKAAFKITRGPSNCRLYRPSAERYIEYVGDPASTVQWTYFHNVGVTTENSNATLPGAYMNINTSATVHQAGYRHLARIRPESRARFSALLDLSAATLASSGDQSRQLTLEIADGLRRIAVGVTDPGGSVRSLSFIDATSGAVIGSAVSVDVTSPWKTVEIKKNGTEAVELFLDGFRVATAAYALFPTDSTMELILGSMSAAAGINFKIKSFDWRIVTDTDYWNIQASDGDTAATNVLNGSNFTDATALVRIKDFTALNAAGGNARGIWAIHQINTANQVHLIGPKERAATFERSTPSRLIVRDNPFAFAWPDRRGASIVIEDGPNAGTYAIANFIDPASGTAFEVLYPELVTMLQFGSLPVPFVAHTNQIAISGTFPDPASLAEAHWHVTCDFPVDAGPVHYEIAPAGSNTGSALSLFTAAPVNTPTVFDVAYSTVLSAQALDSLDDVNTGESGHVFYPFYLWDAFGYTRSVLSALVAAGVKPDFDNFFRDDAGPHLLGDDT